MAKAPEFTFDDAGTFDENLAAFSTILDKMDDGLASRLSSALPALADERQDRAQLLNGLLAQLAAPPDDAQSPAAIAASPPAAATPPAGTLHWFLEEVEIEGIRGINNEGSPLVLKFKTDCVNSVSAPNGVGKSSIYEALSFALTGGIPKLDKLLQAECGQDYYLNRFHPADTGTVKLTLRPDDGSRPVAIMVTRQASGGRIVTGPSGIDADALLAELAREFVLLDAHTFQSFIDVKALDRGRTFSGLLGLARYSLLRQQLQALSNTRAFNAHFDVTGHTATKAAADRAIKTTAAAIARDFESLVKEPLDAAVKPAEAQARCHAALSGTPVLAEHCVSQPLMNLDVDSCINAVKTAEEGPKRARLGEIIREQGEWAKATKLQPADADLPALGVLATVRENALVATAGDLLNDLYRISEQVLSSDAWPTPTLCPTCDRDDGSSVIDVVQAKLGQYAAVDSATAALAAAWNAQGWGDLAALETLTLLPEEVPRLKQLSKSGEAGILSGAESQELAAYVPAMRARAKAHEAALAAERATIEKELPPSLVTVTTAAVSFPKCVDSVTGGRIFP